MHEETQREGITVQRVSCQGGGGAAATHPGHPAGTGSNRRSYRSSDRRAGALSFASQTLAQSATRGWVGLSCPCGNNQYGSSLTIRGRDPGHGRGSRAATLSFHL